MQFGCTTSRLISMNDAKVKESKKNSLVLHTPGSRYQLLDFKFTEDGIEGKLDDYSGDNTNIFHVYTDLNFYYNQYQKSNQFIKVPNKNIQKIKYSKSDRLKTVALVGSLLALMIIIGANSVNFDGSLVSQ